MKNKLWIVLVLLCCIALCFVACSKNKSKDDGLLDFSGITFDGQTVEYDAFEHTITASGVPQSANVTYTGNRGTQVGIYNATAYITQEGYRPLTLRATLQVTPPSAQSIVAARARVLASSDVGYDFSLNLAGTIGISEFNATANANYEGKYRVDGTTGDVRFTRTTSGLLLYDSTEYIVRQGNNRLVVTANDKGIVKKISVIQDADEELLLINKPICALVDSLTANELTDIALASDSEYMFRTTLRFASNNTLLNKILGILGKQGTSIDIKGVSFTNPASGLVMYFNLGQDQKLQDFCISADVSVPINNVSVAGASASLRLTYKQVGSDAEVKLPQIGSVILDKSDIAQELVTVNDAIDSLRSSSAYSLDVKAENQFDPGWNVVATKDKYVARMYKNTYTLNDADFVAFNHSYEYKTHHEEDGAETYKYTIGNIRDGSTYLVSRKGKNAITPLENETADTRFDWLMDAFTYTANDVDCIRKINSGNTTTYTFYLNNAYTVAVNQIISDMINSNDAEGVVKVDNYFNSDNYTVKGANLTVTLVRGNLASITVETEIKYYPTDGNYTTKRITLTDSIELAVNDKLSDAQQYTAPANTTTKLGSYGLNNATYYIQ